jgi:predicted Zn-dependent protease
VTRRKHHGAIRTLQVAVVCFVLVSAMPARAQLGKWIKKAQDAANSKQAKQVKEGVEAAVPSTAEQEKDIGRGVAARVIGHYHLYNHPALTAYVNLVGATVAGQAPPRKGIEYHFAVLDSDWINAYSAPGGYIFITRGALALCKDESELAGVLGHEIAHVTGRHVMKIIDSDRRKRVGKEIGSDYAQRGPAWFRYVSEIGINLAATTIFKKGLPRDDELDADKTGVSYAHAAGYPADGLERFLVKLDKARNQNGISVTQHTHPPVTDRNATIKEWITSHRWQDSDRPKLAERFIRETAAVRAKT